MSRAKVMMLACFLVAFAAGTTLGLLVGRSSRGHGRRSRLSRELGLTPGQREQMRKIWSDVMSSSSGPQRESRQSLREERDEAVRALLTEERKSKYDKVMEEYQQKVEELGRERRARFQEAVERTKEILTDAQREKYEELMKRRSEGGFRSFRGRDRGSGDPERTSRGEE